MLWFHVMIVKNKSIILYLVVVIVTFLYIPLLNCGGEEKAEKPITTTSATKEKKKALTVPLFQESNPIVRKEKIPINEVHLSLLKLGESVIKLHGE